MKNLILTALTAVLLSSCASVPNGSSYFVVAATIGTSEYLASLSPTDRAKADQTIREVAGAVVTLTSGELLTPAQFSAALAAHVPASDTATHILNVVNGTYAAMYIDLKDQPSLKNDWLNQLANAILAQAH